MIRRVQRQRGIQQGRVLFRPYGLLATLCLFLAFVLNKILRINPTVVYISENGSPRHIHKRTTNTNSSDDDIKYILYYTTFWNDPDFAFGFGQEPFQKYCPNNPNCFATNNRAYLKSMGDFDAILFHFIDFNIQKRNTLASIAKWRKVHQRFIFYNLESPHTYPLPKHTVPGHFYNWTMTYRHDSDIPRPYGWIRPKSEQEDSTTTTRTTTTTMYPPPLRESWPIVYNTNDQEVLPFVAKTTARSGKVAWIVSHCDTVSRRMEYALELAKYIPVDIFGKCGKPCNVSYGKRNNNNNSMDVDDCMRTVQSNYKFYLAFENSFCNDYVTEKFFFHLNHDSLVIVMGQADYVKVAPPHSFINVMDYTTAKELATFLWELDHNDTYYQTFFWWKHHYEVNSIFRDHTAQAMCKLCEKLHNHSEPRKTYPDLYDWWTTKAECGRLQANTSHLRIHWKNG